jgi:phosphoglycolate phosphatase-like HAD superfamily hydrolase
VSGVLKVADQSELLTLKREQTTLLDLLQQGDSSQGVKIVRLAQIIERRIDLGDQDCSYPVNQISTMITRMLSDQGSTLATHVSRYLPEKYKDPRLSQYAKLTTHLERVVVDCGFQLGSQQIEQLSGEQLEKYYEQLGETDDALDTTITLVKKNREKCEAVAQERGLQLAGYKFRKPISIHDIPGEVVETLEGLNDATYKNLIAISKYEAKIAEVFKEFPATDYEDAKKYYLGTEAYKTILAPHQDYKWTGDYGHWYDRGYLEVMQGKHGSGNSDKFMSMLCTWCSRDIDDDPDDYERMYMDKDSATGYRCRNCNGVNFVTRETTREQVGDRKEYIFNSAKFVMENLPYWSDVLHDHNRKYVMPYENARKLRISGQFSNSAIAGTDTKVIRNKAK